MTRSESCTCPYGERPMGRLHGIDHGIGIVRLSTTKGCPDHDTCHQWTAEQRAVNRAARPWGEPYCPIHGTDDCPDTAEVI